MPLIYSELLAFWHGASGSRSMQVIGKNNVAVPTHFFKVVVAETASGGGDLEMEAYVMPNEAIPDSAPLASFQVSPQLL